MSEDYNPSSDPQCHPLIQLYTIMMIEQPKARYATNAVCSYVKRSQLSNMVGA